MCTLCNCLCVQESWLLQVFRGCKVLHGVIGPGMLRDKCGLDPLQCTQKCRLTIMQEELKKENLLGVDKELN